MNDFIFKILEIPSFNTIKEDVVFSKTELPNLEILNKIGYVNLAAVKIAVKLLKSVPHDWWEVDPSGVVIDLIKKRS